MADAYGRDGFTVKLHTFSGNDEIRHCVDERGAVAIGMALLRSNAAADTVTVWDDATGAKVFCHGFAKLFFDKRRDPAPL